MERQSATKLQWWFAASILFAGFLSGCGGGGGGSTPPPVVTAPTISTQPQSLTVSTSSAATFTVAASGTGTLAYQWNRNGTPIPGATSATYSISSVALADSGASFTVVVSNSGGQVTSTAAVLTANANPEGVYVGTLTNNTAGTTWPVFAVVLRDGTFSIFAKQSDFAPKVPLGIAITGAKIAPTGGSFTTTYNAYTQPGYVFANGQGRVSGTMTGTVTPGVSIAGTYNSTRVASQPAPSLTTAALLPPPRSRAPIVTVTS